MTGGAAAAAIAQAIKASGAIVRIEPEDFARLIERQDEPLVVHAKRGGFGAKYQYLTNYKGLFFFAKSPTPLYLPGRVEVITAKSIWVP